MSAENEGLARRIVEEGYNQGVMDVLYELVAPGYVENNGMPAAEAGVDGLIGTLLVFKQAFPDLHHEIEDIFSADDRVTLRTRMTGTQLGEFMGMPPSNNQINVMNIEIMRFEGGLMVERWGIFEELVLAVQIGLLAEIEA
jgi:predicted ester cyclase